MANQRNKILAELVTQATHEGETANIRACRTILQHSTTSEEWYALVSTQFHRYGNLSYEAHRFYYVKAWVMPLAEELCKEMTA